MNFVGMPFLSLVQTWEDYMRYWCRRSDFRERLPDLLEGEDPDFQKHISGIADKESRSPKLSAPRAA